MRPTNTARLLPPLSLPLLIIHITHPPPSWPAPLRSVKSEAAEAELPAFDFERRVGLKIQLQKFRRSVVLCVVDVAGARAAGRRRRAVGAGRWGQAGGPGVLVRHRGGRHAIWYALCVVCGGGRVGSM